MSDNGADKHFEPTQSRIERAKREGDLPRSGDLGGAVAFAGGLLGVLVCVPNLAGLVRANILAVASNPLEPGGTGEMLAGVFLWAMLPIATSALSGSAAMLLQNGGLRAVAITWKLDRLSPIEGCKRMLSREAVLAATRAMVAVLCASAVIFPNLTRLLASSAGASSAQELAGLAWSSALRSAFVIALLAGLFGAVDFAVVFAKWRKKLRMSFEEVRRDHKEHDGDPTARGRRRSMHREISRSSFKSLEDAAFVVVNPTHIAIALQYRPPHVAVPRVLLRTADESAVRLREAAVEMKIPIVENISLARALYACAKAGDVIPQESYIAVAQVVAALTESGVLDS